MRVDHRLSRRSMIKGSIVTGGGLAAALGGSGSAFAMGRSRPALTHGVQSGDVTARSAVVWARADRPSRMLVELSHTPSFRRCARIEGPVLTPDTDLAGKVKVRGLKAGSDVFYRVVLEDLRNPFVTSEPEDGHLVTAPWHPCDVSFVWGADVVGQGWGINPEFGGLRIFQAMAALEPDFYLCSGDHVYADGPLTETVTLPDGRVWRNVVTPAKSKVAETLDEFRGQYAYNLLDEHLKAFNARVPQYSQWDDHEVINNWYPGEILPADDVRYTEKDVDVLAARGKQAFFEWLPITPKAERAGTVYRKVERGPLLDLFVLDMRTFKDPNDENTYADPSRGLLGAEQREWLKRELSRSQAVWKVLAIDLPLGLLVPDGETAWEGVAQGDPGAPLGRELDFADVLAHVHRTGIENLVMLTADVHYTAAHHYDPSRAAFKEFTPFWEFVSGPLHAGGFGPNALDATFGPEAVFVAAPPAPNASPLEGYQFFGEVSIEAASRRMTVNLRDIDGAVLFSTEIDPA